MTPLLVFGVGDIILKLEDEKIYLSLHHLNRTFNCRVLNANNVCNVLLDAMLKKISSIYLFF